MFVYLILHYKNADITEQCINSLLKNDYPDAQIVVVDNASCNGSYEKLCNEYQQFKHIHFLQNNENLGYAAGNNVGFQYAKYTLGANWIVLLNNDVTIEQTDFQEVLLREYKESHFYIAGPDIVTPDGGNQNPFLEDCPKKRDIMKKLLHDYIVIALMKVGLQQKLKKVLHYDGSIFHENEVQTIRDFAGVLHGSCIIFSPDYIKEFNGLYGGTFLYCEEEILCYILKKLHKPYSYLKSLKVTHRHSVTMKREIQDEDKRKMQEIRRRIASYKKFLHIVNTKKDISSFLT